MEEQAAEEAMAHEIEEQEEERRWAEEEERCWVEEEQQWAEEAWKQEEAWRLAEEKWKQAEAVEAEEQPEMEGTQLSWEERLGIEWAKPYMEDVAESSKAGRNRLGPCFPYESWYDKGSFLCVQWHANKQSILRKHTKTTTSGKTLIHNFA